MDSIFLKDVHESWLDFLTNDIKKELVFIENTIGDNFVPYQDEVLKFLKRDLGSIKCIWVGQDPYFTVYDKNIPVANGTAFCPRNLTSWLDSFSQRSLQNIIRLVYKSEKGIEEYRDIPKYSQIKLLIKDEKFKILPPQEWFCSLEDQGVLFLNTYFTTISGKGNAHKTLWEPFSAKLYQFIANTNCEAIWFLWGSEAQAQKKYLLPTTRIYESNHPTFCSEKYENDFLKNNCFKETQNIINWVGF